VTSSTTAPPPSRRTALVTGASSGIGLATTRRLAGRGFHVLGGVLSELDAQRLARETARTGVCVEPIVADLTDAAACERAVDGRRVDVLVNNAGFFGAGAIEDIAREDARRQLETMALAPMHLAQLVLPGMRERGHGRIVNVSTVLVYLALPFVGWYQASNRALETLSDALRLEVAADGIDVVLVQPGATRTKIWQEADDELHAHERERGDPDTYDRARAALRAAARITTSPDLVGRTIARAATTPSPRHRYRVGRGATAMWLLGAAVPQSLRDRAVRAGLGL
jgi:short-subunit dehydrogenase